MAGLSVIFKAVDEISSKFDSMSSAGSGALDAFDRLESAADSSYDTIVDGATQASKAVENAANSTDYWTDAIGNYDKGAMEAIYSTEELVEMGYKTEDALEAAGKSADEAAEQVDKFGDESEEAGKKSEKFGDESTSAIGSLDKVIAAAGIGMAIKEIGEEFVEASQAATEFTSNLAKLTTIADTSVLSADQLSGQISSLSSDMAQSVNDIADSAYNAISAGVDTANAVDTVGTATELAVSGFTNVSSALSVLTTATNAYNLDASEMTNISDSLIMTQNKGVLTIDQLSSSIGKAISTASAYSVDLYNLESGYISLTKSGISVEESTTYISSMFNELGDAGSDVSKVLQDETGKTFGQLMADGYSLADALEVVYASTNNNAEAMMNLWGSAEAGKAANAIINQGLETFNNNLDSLHNSAGTTAAAYETMTSTSEFATQRMTNSFDNLQIAIGKNLNPAVSKFQNGISDVTEQFTKLVEKHPAISAVLTGVTVGIGAVIVGVTGYIAVTKLAAVATTELAAAGVTLGAVLGPAALVVTGIAAITAAVILMSDAETDAEKAQQTLTSSSKEMAAELEDLESQYDNMVDAGEEDTVAAYQLKNQIDELSESFEENKQTIGDLMDANKELKTSIDEVTTTYDETMTSIGKSESDAKSLIAQLASMQEQTDLSGGQMEIMESIVDRLNGSYEGLNLTLDKTNGKLNMSIEELWKAVSDAAAQDKAQANMDALMGYLEQYQEAQKTFQEANKTMNDNYAEYERALDEDWADEHPFLAWTGWADGAEMNWDGSVKDAFNAWEQAKSATDEAESNFNNLEESIRSCYEAMGYSTEEIDTMMAELATAASSATDFAAGIESTEEALVSADDAVSTAVSGVKTQLEELATAYDEAYKAAQESVEGQYNLWDTASTIVSMSSDEISAALQSQIDYWNSYNTNLDTLSGKAGSIEGLSDVLAAVADGSEDSAAMLSGMASMSDEQLQAMVDQYTSLQTSQDNTATSMADLETKFSESLDTMKTNMESAVGEMNMEDEARTAANATMDAYIAAIKSKTAEVHSAMSAISFANTNTPGLNGYATGTLDAEPGLALVGEDGPELINFGGGEVVYPTEETAEILSSNPNNDFYVAPSENEPTSEQSDDKTITLKIEGSGDMKIGSNMSKDDVVSVLMENMKDALMSIIHTEILEEGDGAYEF